VPLRILRKNILTVTSDAGSTLRNPRHVLIIQNNAENQTNIFGEEPAKIIDVPQVDLKPCDERRFIPPTGEWDRAAGVLDEQHMVVLRGQAGSGRRTAALRLLRETHSPEKLHYLIPDWQQPKITQLIDLRPEHGYVLDMTDPAETPPKADFGERLIAYIQESQSDLVIITTPQTWSGSWISGTGTVTIDVGSPSAISLVASELVARSGQHLLSVLTTDSLGRIWSTNPTARNSVRLASIIIRRGDGDPRKIIDEYTQWQEWIDDHLPEEIDPRLLIWSCSFCNGGARKSILLMADNLRALLKQERTPEQALLDPPSFRRLRNAGLTVKDGKARLPLDHPDLDIALRLHLWDEYELQQEILAKWLVSSIQILPIDDSGILALAVLDLALRCHDDALLESARDALVTYDPNLAISLITEKLLDAEHGPYLRERVARWLRRENPQRAIVDTVARICAGKFGAQQPAVALTRLRLAAARSPLDSQVIITAFSAMAERNAANVLDTIASWANQISTRSAAIRSFLFLASSVNGARSLCSLIGDSGSNAEEVVISLFHLALQKPSTRRSAREAIRIWGDDADYLRRLVPHLPRLLGSFFAPRAQTDSMAMFPGVPNPDTLWGSVYQEALRQNFAAESPATAPHQAVGPPVPAIAPVTTKLTTSSFDPASAPGPVGDDDLPPTTAPEERSDVAPVMAPASVPASRADGSPEVLAAGETLLPEEDAVRPTDSALDEVRIPSGFNGAQIPVLPATADQDADDDSRDGSAQVNNQPNASLPQPASTDSAESTPLAANRQSFSLGFSETPST